MAKKLFVTGATGFIGTHLLEKLKASKNYDVTILVSSSEIGQKKMPDGVNIEFADLADHPRVSGIIEKVQPQIIVHLAAITPVRFSYEQPDIYQEINFLATVNLVKAAMKVKNFEKFIFASTMETYGIQYQKKPFKETNPLNPASPYSVAKVAAEDYIKVAGLAYNFPHIVMRCCNTFGRKTETGYVIEHIVASMLRNTPPQLGTPESVRDFMYVDDHVNAYLKAIEYRIDVKNIRSNLEQDINFYAFNFGNGLQDTIMQVAQKIAKIVGYKGRIEVGWPKNYPFRPINEPYLSLDATKARTVLGWKPTVTFEEGLKKTIDYWKGALAKNPAVS